MRSASDVSIGDLELSSAHLVALSALSMPQCLPMSQTGILSWAIDATGLWRERPFSPCAGKYQPAIAMAMQDSSTRSYTPESWRKVNFGELR